MSWAKAARRKAWSASGSNRSSHSRVFSAWPGSSGTCDRATWARIRAYARSSSEDMAHPVKAYEYCEIHGNRQHPESRSGLLQGSAQSKDKHAQIPPDSQFLLQQAITFVSGIAHHEAACEGRSAKPEDVKPAKLHGLPGKRSNQSCIAIAVQNGVQPPSVLTALSAQPGKFPIATIQHGSELNHQARQDMKRPPGCTCDDQRRQCSNCEHQPRNYVGCNTGIRQAAADPARTRAVQIARNEAIRLLAFLQGSQQAFPCSREVSRRVNILPIRMADVTCLQPAFIRQYLHHTRQAGVCTLLQLLQNGEERRAPQKATGVIGLGSLRLLAECSHPPRLRPHFGCIVGVDSRPPQTPVHGKYRAVMG